MKTNMKFSSLALALLNAIRSSAFVTPSSTSLKLQLLLHSSSTASNEVLLEGGVDEALSKLVNGSTSTCTDDKGDCDLQKDYSMKTKSLSPAEYENKIFACDASVQGWKDFQRSGLSDSSDNIREIVNVANRFINKGEDAIDYWLVGIINIFTVNKNTHCFFVFVSEFYLIYFLIFYIIPSFLIFDEL